MAWYDDLISNLANAVNPKRNLEYLLGMGDPLESGMVDPNTGEEIPMEIGIVDPFGFRGSIAGNAGRAVPAARSATRGARSVPAAGRGSKIARTARSTRATPTRTPSGPTRGRIPGGTPEPAPRGRPGTSAGRPTGVPRDVPAARAGRTATGGRQAGGGALDNTASQYTPRTSSNPNTQMMDDVMRMGKGKKAAAIAALTGGGAMAASGLAGGGRQEGGAGPEGLYGGNVAGAGTGARSMSGTRALTPEEEARTLGAPGSGGLNDPRLAGGMGSGDPMMDMINDSYDRYASMIDDMSGVYDNLAQTNMEEIGQIFGEVAGVASGGQAPLAQTYEQAQGNVGEIYGALDERLGGIAGEMQGIAEGAAGSAAGDVATVSQGAIAPFQAASATANANAQANIAQHSSAGQGYLSNLASASTEEGKMHATRLQAAAQQRQAEFDVRRMEIEMAREEALREVAMDTAGSTAEREAMAMLFGQAGLPVPEGFTEMGQGQEYLNLAQDLGTVPTPGSGGGDDLNSAMSQLSGRGQDLFQTAVKAAEDAWTPNSTNAFGETVAGDRTQDFMFDVLAALDDQIAGLTENKKEHPFVTPDYSGLEQEAEMIRQIIRDQYGKF